MANTRPEKGKLAFQKYMRTDGDVGVRIIAANGEVLMHSEGYKDVRDADNVITLIAGKAHEAEVQDLR